MSEVLQYFLCLVYTAINPMQCIFHLRCFCLWEINLDLFYIFLVSICVFFAKFLNMWNVVTTATLLSLPEFCVVSGLASVV